MRQFLLSAPKFMVFAVPIAFLAIFFFYPLLSIFQVSFAPGGQPDLSGFVALVTRPYYRELLWFTTWQAALSTVLTLLAGMPAAYAFARFSFPGKTLLRAVLTVPFVMPTVVVATAFLALLGPRGSLNGLLTVLFGPDAPAVNLQHTVTLILLAHVFYNIAIVIRVVGGFWANLDPQLEEAAMVLGARPRQLFREVTLPLLMPAIGAAALLIFLFTFSSFGVVLLLGGVRYATIEVEIYQQAVNLFNLPLAASLSLVQMVFTFLLMWLYTGVQARATVPLNLRSQVAVQKPARTARQRFFLLAALGLPALFVLAPLTALVERSLSVGGEWTLQYYLTLSEAQRRSIFAVSPLVAVRNSVLFALATTAISVILALLSAYLLAPRRGEGRRGLWRRVLDPLFLLPLGTSAVTLGFGYIVALDAPPLNLRTSALLVPIAHSLIAFPFVLRSLLPTLRSINPALREAAAVLGARPLGQLREVDLPIIARSLLVGAVFAFAISMGEFGATSLIWRPEWPTLPIVIFRFLGQPGVANYGRALAMSVILMSTTALAFILIERVRVDEGSEF
ncbi:MAG TPA: iron ABC transporter permease [Ardenticatenaceae bacterium]|jgi:thiamine transport system permease protein